MPYLASRLGPATRGAPSAGGSTEMLAPPLTALLLLLVRGCRRLLERSRDAVHVVRALEEVLEDLPLALSGRPPERDRLEVRQVEPLGLRRDEPFRRCPLEWVAVRAQRDVVVGRREPALLDPDQRRLRRGQVFHEGLDRRVVAERDDRV